MKNFLLLKLILLSAHILRTRTKLKPIYMLISVYTCMLIKMEQVFHKVILNNRIYKAIEVSTLKRIKTLGYWRTTNQHQQTASTLASPSNSKRAWQNIHSDIRNVLSDSSEVFENSILNVYKSINVTQTFWNSDEIGLKEQ